MVQVRPQNYRESDERGVKMENTKEQMLIP